MTPEGYRESWAMGDEARKLIYSGQWTREHFERFRARWRELAGPDDIPPHWLYSHTPPEWWGGSSEAFDEIIGRKKKE